MEYDFIIQNPPYSRTFHLEFLKKGIELLKKDSGKMTIIEPATWLINVRKNGKASKYDEIKSMLKGHVSKVVIENLNKEFNTGLYVPFAITYIDFSKEHNDIEFNCCGEKKIVNSLYDCNMIGSYDLIWSIFDKVQGYGDMMKNHVTKKEVVNKDIYYLPYSGIMPAHGYDSNIDYIKVYRGEYYGTYITPCIHKYRNTPQKEVGLTKANNPNPCITGTKEELENWKHFVFNNKLPLFINIAMTINQNNNSLDFIPWLVDKQYTDEEINDLFKFTPEELNLIDKTIKKFERNSPWFKRYMSGKDSVSNKDVQKFIDSL